MSVFLFSLAADFARVIEWRTLEKMFIGLSTCKAIPEISSKTSLSWLHFKTGEALRREENNKVEFLEGQFRNDTFSFVH